MKPARVETLVWVLIYGGLALLILGLWVRGADAAVGQVLAWAGGLLALVGVLLIWIRSRMPDGPG
ncbi:hypothetical protein [uncultured Methylibium sp.]|uniref:hypothetical protein n=1 Tax=uncultured Methylibium sp. TaxID=381093 RepID=UPI0026015271|nr:hypothetical protein [uncultured Methylibium sp.]